MAISTRTASDWSPLFKRIYGQRADNVYGTGAEDPVESQVSKKYGKLKGERFEFPVRLGFGGGVGKNTLPTANMSRNRTVSLEPVNVYARVMLERKTMKMSKGNEAAFVEATKEETNGKIKSFNRMVVCDFFNDSTGTLGQFSGNATGSATNPVITILATGTYGFRPGFFEEGDYININSLSSVWEVDEVNTTTRAVTLVRRSGSDDLTTIGAGTHSVYLQNSKDASPWGFKEAVEKTSGSWHGVTVQRRWRSPYQNTLSSPRVIGTDLLNDGMIQIEAASGEYPTLIGLSHAQYKLLLDQLEDPKRYNLTSKGDGRVKASVSFPGIEFAGAKGTVPIVASRYIRSDACYFMNMNKIERHHTEEFGWFDEDGTILMRLQDLDAYEARYGGYMNNFINPQYHGFIYGLATS